MGSEREIQQESRQAAPGPVAARESRSLADAVLRLQRTAGNRAVGQLLGGLDPYAPEPGEADELDEPVGGVGSFLRSIADRFRTPRPVTLAPVGQPTGGTQPALHTPPSTPLPPTPTPITISTTSNTGPTWNANGSFDWRVGFTTSGRNGWIVQEIVNTMNVFKADGTQVDTSAVVPRYWEAWAVDGSGAVTPAIGADNDYWIRPARGASTRGNWSMTGNCHFTTTDPATQGFTSRGVSNAGILLSTTTQPTGLGTVRLRRTASGSWDSTTAPGTAHSGSAGP
jgi:hypothetical protein